MARHLLARIDRQALHARLLGFEHPDGRHVEFTCPPPDDFNNLLDTARGELI